MDYTQVMLLFGFAIVAIAPALIILRMILPRRRSNLVKFLPLEFVQLPSEFGRTPKINATAGRDHWPKVFSVVMAGGGIKNGMVYGTSNATASEPDENAMTVEDWAATIYNRIGIVSDKELMAPGDRPIEIVDGGKVVQDLIV